MKIANQVLNKPDQPLSYNAIQLSLPINTLLIPEKDDEIFSYLEAVEGVNFRKYVKPIRSNNTNSHSRIAYQDLLVSIRLKYFLYLS